MSLFQSFYCHIRLYCIDLLHFIYSSVDGYLDCSHFLASITNAAVNIVYTCLCEGVFSFSWVGVKLLGVKLLVHMITLCLNF